MPHSNAECSQAICCWLLLNDAVSLGVEDLDVVRWSMARRAKSHSSPADQKRAKPSQASQVTLILGHVGVRFKGNCLALKQTALTFLNSPKG